MGSVSNLCPSTDLLLCRAPSLQGADSRDLQMNQALRLLENEHQELQAKIEHLQGDRDLYSSDTQHLQGTVLGGLWLSELQKGGRVEEKVSVLGWLCDFILPRGKGRAVLIMEA